MRGINEAKQHFYIKFGVVVLTILWVNLPITAQPFQDKEIQEYTITAIDSLEHHYIIYASNNDNIYTIISYKGLPLSKNISVDKKYHLALKLTLECLNCGVSAGDAQHHLGFGDYLWLPNDGYRATEIIGLHYFQNQDSLQYFNSIRLQLYEFDNNMLHIWMNLDCPNVSYGDFLKEKDRDKKSMLIQYQEDIILYEYYSSISFSDTVLIKYQPDIEAIIYYEYLDYCFVKLILDDKFIFGWIKKGFLEEKQADF